MPIGAFRLTDTAEMFTVSVIVHKQHSQADPDKERLPTFGKIGQRRDGVVHDLSIREGRLLAEGRVDVQPTIV